MRILCLRSGHDASATILNDGNIEYYFKEERYSRIKKDESIKNLIKILVDNYNLIGDIDYFNFSINEHIENMCHQDLEILRSLLYGSKQITYNAYQHHLYHASNAFYNSGFEKAIVFVADASGAPISINDEETFESESVYIAEYPCKFKPILKNYWTGLRLKNKKERKLIGDCTYNISSITNYITIGNLYNSAALASGGSVNDCGKAMGLSSYGESIDKSFDLLGIKGRELIMDYFSEESKFVDYLEFRTERLDTPNITESNYKKISDYCYEVQIQTTDYVCKIIGDAIKKTNIKKVCLSGGYAMNIVTNYELVKRYPDVEFYFEPLCDDSGLAVGSSMYFYRRISKDKTILKIKDTFNHGFNHDLSKYNSDQVANSKDISRLLFENKSVGIYGGISESGQRALGNRSILFNALNPNAKDIVNAIKKREWYRPFAAIVLKEDASKYFDDIFDNEFMTVCFPVKTNLIPGVTHVDKTCRVQTVSGGHLYDILQEFKKLSGHGILLNTSLNLSGEPLVESPDQAFDTLRNSTLDYLWFYQTKQLFKSPI
jgi:carbamoyltransferase